MTLLLRIFWACLLTSLLHAAPLPAERDVTIYVSSNGWHCGLHLPVRALRRQTSLPVPAWAARQDWIEIGWGNRAFYMARKFDLGLAVRALSSPTPSVVHLCGYRGIPAQMFPVSQMLPLRLTADQFRRLWASIAPVFERGPRGDLVDLGPGLYLESRFYAALGAYYFPKTCNVWLARQLRNAGLPFQPWLSTASGAVMMQVRSLEREQTTRREPTQLRQRKLD